MKSSTFKYLVIEDDTNVWANIERRMNKFPEWKYAYFSAEIDDALLKIKKEMPQLIFSDWSIKGGNAFQVLQFINETKDYHPYVVFFTGYQSEHPEIPQEIMNNYPVVKKYLIKPIYENLTNHLENYLTEAKQLYFSLQKGQDFFIENERRQQIKINPKETISILQCDENPRHKILNLKNREEILLKQTWDEIMDFLHRHQINYHVCHNRKIIVNKAYINKYSKPFIWLENGDKIRVSRDRWDELM